jgi:hypothetical protein
MSTVGGESRNDGSNGKTLNARVKPEISGPLILLGISVVDQYVLQSIAVGIASQSFRPAIHAA